MGASITVAKIANKSFMCTHYPYLLAIRFFFILGFNMSDVSVPLATSMFAIILLSVLGNLLVVLSVLLVRALRQPSNLLLLSLAVTDLLVSLIVMPGALLQQLVGDWPLNDSTCMAWVFADVFLCTSSILSLTAICIGT